MPKFIITRVGRVRSARLGRIGDVYSIHEVKTGKSLQVYKPTSVWQFLQEGKDKDKTYAIFVDPYCVGEIKIREAEKLPRILHGIIYENIKWSLTEILDLDNYFLNKIF